MTVLLSNLIVQFGNIVKNERRFFFDLSAVLFPALTIEPLAEDVV